MFSINPPLTEQSQVLSELGVFYHWIVITIIHSNSPPHLSQVSKLVRRIQNDKPLLTIKTASVNISDQKSVKQYLSNIKTLKTSLIVLYCTSKEAKVILVQAENHNLFDGELEWMLTDNLLEDTSLIPWIPVGMLGMRIHSTNESSFIQDLAHDAVIATSHAQMLNLKNGKAANETRFPNCYGASVIDPSKPVFSR